MLSFPAPRISCLSRFRVAHSSAYRSGSSPYVFFMYDFNGAIQSISLVALSGTDIIGVCGILGGRFSQSSDCAGGGRKGGGRLESGVVVSTASKFSLRPLDDIIC